MTAPPQVIRRNDGSLAVLNVDLDRMSNIERVALGIQVWPQIRLLMEVSGEYKPRDPRVIGANGIGTTEDIDRVAARTVGAQWHSVSRLRPKLLKRPDLVARMQQGEFETLNDVARAAGMTLKTRLVEGRPSSENVHSGVFGSGDKFDTAIEPIRRYLIGWEKKGFSFTHVNPKEAKRRLKLMDEVIDNLSKAREDIAMRSHVATLTAPPEKKRRENS